MTVWTCLTCLSGSNVDSIWVGGYLICGHLSLETRARSTDRARIYEHVNHSAITAAKVLVLAKLHRAPATQHHYHTRDRDLSLFGLPVRCTRPIFSIHLAYSTPWVPTAQHPGTLCRPSDFSVAPMYCHYPCTAPACCTRTIHPGTHSTSPQYVHRRRKHLTGHRASSGLLCR